MRLCHVRGRVAIMVALVLASPLAASLAPRSPAPVPDAAAFDPSDAELMLLLARLDHPGLVPLNAPEPSDIGLPDLLMRVGVRAQAPLSPADAAQFATLDPRLSAPLVTLFLAIEHAWDAVDVATAGLSEDEARELYALREAGLEGSPRGVELVAQVDRVTLLAAAIMLTAVVEDTVLPQLVAASDAGVWPARGVWDSAGVLRLGGTGVDVELLDRIVQIDPRGDDQYANNAGGSTVLDPLFGDFNILTPIAVSIDLAGNDRYDTNRFSSLGASQLNLGFGLALDLAGDDYYACLGECIGYGLGLLRDYAGRDVYLAPSSALGNGLQLGIIRDDAGDDRYQLNFQTAGYANLAGETGLLWDRGGTDAYETYLFSDGRLGWGNQGGRGWFVDEGPEADVYETATTGALINRHGCNDCTWEKGTPFNGFPVAGEGNDNRGGLAYLLWKQDPLLRDLP